MSAHTPGPWRVGEPVLGQVPVYGPDGQAIAHCESGPDVSHEEREANALLIASAPGLLEAAKHAMAVWPDHLRFSTLEAAIAKAEGR